ncbi:Ada metal-binding domain-containing protein [Mesonia sp. K7]|uniref:Ada metal-binding domain-containing protein n=1 Tax=Mesonia sp. K7 TaxID=2218606 RepID=UPI000DAA037F|nr:Ada metal-binding domain-containing protein [Mesonia sp. K7]PZD76622.1 hypothetical protein DNG35_11570 [Mesonia sp. K7]
MKKLLFFLLIAGSLLSFGFSLPTIPVNHSHVQPVTEVVYITKTGNKYHKSSCRYLKNSKIKTTKTEAKAAGYTACKVCKP